MDNKAKVIEADLSKKSEKHQKIQNTIAATQQELGKTKGRIDTLETESNKLLKWLEKADIQLNQLRKSGYIQADETTSVAIARIDEQLATTEETISELKASREEIKESINQFGLEKQSVTNKISTLEKDAEKASNRLLAYQNELQSLSHHQTLCDLVETDEINPYSPDLENSLKNAQEKLNQELRQVQNQLDLDQEDVDALSESSVLPPGRDVRTVLQHLKDNSIGAYSYGEYLTKQGDITPDTIREKMNRDPARYGGIAVISPEHLERVKQEFQTLKNLRCPVQITDKEAAAIEKSRLERNIENNKTRLSDIKEEYTAYGEILSTLRAFLKAHPEGAEARYQQAITDIQQQIASKREHFEKLERDIGILEERQESVSVSLMETEAKGKKLNNQEQQLVEAIKNQENDLRTCRDALNNIVHRSPKDRSLVTQYEHNTELQLREIYFAKKVSYDEGVKASDKLRGQLEELTKQRTVAQKEYHAKRGSYGEQEVNDILARCEQSIGDSLLETLNEKVLKARDIETLAKADKKKAKREFDEFKAKGVPQKPEELTSFEY